jgi:AcrR family transcriptional regulator
MVYRRSEGQCRADSLAIAATRRLRALASGPLGGLIVDSFRVVPQQERSMDSVERMLAAVERLARRASCIDHLTLESIAAEAHVTPQAAYRYFRDVDDVVRLFVRRVQTVEHEQLLAALVTPRFASAEELAEAAVSFVIDAYSQFFAVSERIRDRIVRDHAEISYGLVWTLSEIACATMSGRGDPCAAIGAVPLNAALVAISAVAISFCVRDDRHLTSGRTRAMMLEIFLGAAGRAAAAAP